MNPFPRIHRTIKKLPLSLRFLLCILAFVAIKHGMIALSAMTRSDRPVWQQNTSTVIFFAGFGLIMALSATRPGTRHEMMLKS